MLVDIHQGAGGNLGSSWLDLEGKRKTHLDPARTLAKLLGMQEGLYQAQAMAAQVPLHLLGSAGGNWTCKFQPFPMVAGGTGAHEPAGLRETSQPSLTPTSAGEGVDWGWEGGRVGGVQCVYACVCTCSPT